jgi:hypothetical protein
MGCVCGKGPKQISLPNLAPIDDEETEILYEWTAKIRIHKDLVDFGFIITPENLREMICRTFPYARLSGIETELVDPNEMEHGK